MICIMKSLLEKELLSSYFALVSCDIFSAMSFLLFYFILFWQKAAKRKKIHAFKSKVRLEQQEVVQNKRQNAWQQFQTTKGKAKKIGFFSGRKRESIFKSPDDPKGKVGVTGSGKGLTEFQKREKHLHLKAGGSADTEEEE
ncbi:hypothetical protein DsansV1_C19g0161541 [Dioscorea sansibarensis]